MVANAILNRKSVRSYSDKPVEDKIIKEILTAGMMAPSWVNVQPWHFIVVKNQAVKDKLSIAANNQNQVKNASAVVCCVADMTAWEDDKFSKVMEKQGRNADVRNYILSNPVLNPSLLGEYETLLRTIEQMSYAIGYMTLRAEELGVGCCIVGAIANELTHNENNAATTVKELLGLNEKQILISLLTLGYEKEHIKTVKSRKDFDEVVSFEKLGEKYSVSRIFKYFGCYTCNNEEI